MPGFSELGSHFSDFNERVSDREARQRRIDEKMSLYFKSLGLELGWFKYKLVGHKLCFEYTMHPIGRCVRRVVDLKKDTYVEYEIKKTKSNILYLLDKDKFIIFRG